MTTRSRRMDKPSIAHLWSARATSEIHITPPHVQNLFVTFKQEDRLHDSQNAHIVVDLHSELLRTRNVEDIKARVAIETGFAQHLQILLFQDETLHHMTTNHERKSYIQGFLPSTNLETAELYLLRYNMEILVRNRKKKTFRLLVNNDYTIEYVKLMIQSRMTLCGAPHNIYLAHNGKRLEDDFRLSNYDIQEGNQLDLTLEELTLPIELIENQFSYKLI